MGRSLSDDLKWRIIYCQAEGFTQKEISKRMYVSEATVNKVCRIFKKWGCVKDPFVGRVGRRKIFTMDDMQVKHFKYYFTMK
jgi:transposase